MTFKTWPKPFQYFKDVRMFLVAVSVIVSLITAFVFFLHDRSANNLLIQSVKQEAASYANLIVLTRHWNASYGGVYVLKKPGVESNPYLLRLGVEPDITTRDGRTLTLRNPAIMTREISELTRRQNNIWFHLVSRQFINPDNRPDPFEERALELFSRGTASEVWELVKNGPEPAYRYVMPLFVEEPCLECHSRHEYRVGDVRGGLSISIPAKVLDTKVRTSRVQIILVAAVTIALLLSVLYFMTWQLVVRLDKVQKRLKNIAVTDELTGLKNRRYIMEQIEKEYQRAVRTGGPLSLILLDIDHFKRINDTYGHAVGDQVLKEVAAAMKASLRSYDLLGRIGGEEFLVASPGSTREDAAGLADRILKQVRGHRIGEDGNRIAVTLSAGVTSLDRQDAKVDSLLRRADAALYAAKQGGRDRVAAR